MGFFDKLFKKASEEVNKVQDKFKDEKEVEVNNNASDEDDDFDVTQTPKGWENLSDDEILGKLSLVALGYSQSNDGEKYLKEQGFESEDHLMGYRDYFQNMLAEKRGISMYELIGQTTQATQQQMMNTAQTMKGTGGIMEPVEGVTCEEWAKVNAMIVSGIPLEDAIKEIGADLAKWDRVKNEWQTRMSNDTSFTISMVYANAFNASATGNLGKTSDISEESFPFEKWIEVSVAQEKLNAIGKDPQEILASFGLTVVDWSNASSFWSLKFSQNVEKYYKEDIRLRKIYEEKYKSGSVHDDIEF